MLATNAQNLLRQTPFYEFPSAITVINSPIENELTSVILTRANPYFYVPAETSEIEIFDILGQQVYKEFGAKDKLDFTKFSQSFGFYIAKLKKSKEEKFIKILFCE